MSAGFLMYAVLHRACTPESFHVKQLHFKDQSCIRWDST